MAAVDLDVSLMKSGMHSGEGSGVVASSFRVLRILLDRIEDSRTGEIKLPELHMPLGPPIYETATSTLKALGEENYRANFSKHPDVEFAHQDTVQLFLGGNYKPTLSITGMEGLPDIANAGNVLRVNTKVRLSFRIPPGLDARKCGEAVVAELSRDPPYNAHVTATLTNAGNGYMAPTPSPELRATFKEASELYFGQDIEMLSMGGTIPLMNQLQTLFPKAAFMVTGCLGPGSNAHCPNEVLRVGYMKQFICALTHVMNKIAS
jgi:acetylornithine deacetylase/succinyl-diaminopimelate desuccinylase-like protein